jgi:hypothetical protein
MDLTYCNWQIHEFISDQADREARLQDWKWDWRFYPLNAKLNPICHLLALLAHHILHISRIRVNWKQGSMWKICISCLEHFTEDKLFRHVCQPERWKQWFTYTRCGKTFQHYIFLMLGHVTETQSLIVHCFPVLYVWCSKNSMDNLQQSCMMKSCFSYFLAHLNTLTCLL